MAREVRRITKCVAGQSARAGSAERTLRDRIHPAGLSACMCGHAAQRGFPGRAPRQRMTSKITAKVTAQRAPLEAGSGERARRHRATRAAMRERRSAMGFSREPMLVGNTRTRRTMVSRAARHGMPHAGAWAAVRYRHPHAAARSATEVRPAAAMASGVVASTAVAPTAAAAATAGLGVHKAGKRESQNNDCCGAEDGDIIGVHSAAPPTIPTCAASGGSGWFRQDPLNRA